MFPPKCIDVDFTYLINQKVDDISFTILDELKENEKDLYEVLDKWLLVNYDNRLNLQYNVNILTLNYEFTSNYYFHLFKTKNMQIIVDMIKGYIMNFFLDQNNKQKNTAQALIFLLLNSPNDQFCLYVLDQMNKLIMNKKDFYRKEENERYQLYKLFFEKCKDLYKNPNISEGKYLNEISAVKYAIINKIQNFSMPYDIINN